MSQDDMSVSIIIPTYNRSGLLKRAINSVLPQLLPSDEILVVDDGSTDDTQSVVEGFGEPVRYLKVPNSGPSNARNVGITHAKGDLLAFLDDDDEWFANKLLLQRTLFQCHSEYLFVFSNFSNMYKDGAVKPHGVMLWGQREKRWDHVFPNNSLYSQLAPLPPNHDDFKVYYGDIYNRQMYDDYVLPSTLMMRNNEVTKTLKFPVDLRFCESWAFSSLLAQNGQGAYLDIDTIYQHDHDGGRLTAVDQLLKTTSRITVLERQWGSDKKFLEDNKAVYENRLDEERLLRIRELLSLGKTQECRQDIKLLHGGCPLPYRMLSLLPAAFLLKIIRLRQSFR
jgi:glycosyltransferase involved in cell wall biosynthesis